MPEEQIKVEYIHHSGDDLTTVNAARVSFDKESEWVCSECGQSNWVHDYDYTYYCSTCQSGDEITLSGKDTKLVKYLAEHEHWTPFAHNSITLRVTAPIFVRTHCFKHKVGFVENEISRRYVDDPPEFYTPSVWRGKPKDKKQGSSGVVDLENVSSNGGYFFNDFGEETLSFRISSKLAEDLRLYKLLIDEGVSPEQARMILPQSMMTSWFWTGSLVAYANFYNKRSKEDTQYETRLVANQVSEVMQELYPVSWEALTNA